jgi:SAM-dependent methyltransferase
MPRAGELTYYEVIGEGGRHHALNKPFSQPDCGLELMQVGAILELLPPPPARVLECGCGTGWLARILQKRGYDVVGTDVAPDAIDLARNNTYFDDAEPLDFRVADSEDLPFDAEFDAVIFYDALHHSVDEQAAIDGAYRALKPGGVCIASEPAWGHEDNSREVVARYDVTEKDMPPAKVARLARAAGFRKVRFFPRLDALGGLLFPPPRERFWLWRWLPFRPKFLVHLFWLTTLGKRNQGIAVLTK